MATIILAGRMRLAREKKLDKKSLKCTLRVCTKGGRFMEASIVDLRRKMSEVIKALDRNESVTILYRGKKKGLLVPIKKRSNEEKPIKEHPAYGMWKNRDDMKRVVGYVRKLRKRKD